MQQTKNFFHLQIYFWILFYIFKCWPKAEEKLNYIHIVQCLTFLDSSFYNNVNIKGTQYLISTIYNLSSAFECQVKCWDPSISSCQFFTFYKANGTGNNTCYLRSSASGDKSISDNYITGPIYSKRMIGRYYLIFCLKL